MKRILSFILIMPLLIGCAGTMTAKLDNVRGAYFNSDFDVAAQTIGANPDKSFEDMDNLELLVKADTLFHQNLFSDSDAAYEEFNQRNLNISGFDLGRETAVFLGGNMAAQYKPYMMDNLFVSYYQLWNALADDRYDDARVIINQSYDKQQKMSYEYADLISQTQTAAADNYDVASIIQNDNSQWYAYGDIMNPALTYLSGLYFLINSDFSDARTFLSRAQGMAPENSFIKQDLQDAENKIKPKNKVWIFIEDSFAPKLYETRMDLPIITGQGVAFMSVAMSEPVFFDTVITPPKAQLLSSTDALFMTEYSQNRLNEAIRAWTAASAKFASQAALMGSNDPYAQMFGSLASLYSIASTNAEVRTWPTLPKTISVIRQDNNGKISFGENGDILNADIPDSGNYFIYIRFLRDKYDLKMIKLK